MWLFGKAMLGLWSQVVNHNKVLLLVTDAGSYMVKVTKHLKMSYPRKVTPRASEGEIGGVSSFHFLCTTKYYTPF